MASLTIDHLEDSLLSRLRSRADARGTSIEEEAATILGQALVSESSGERLVRVFREEFGPLGGVELEMPPRQHDWTPPAFK